MSVVVTLLELVAFVALTAGTALLVAAEFSLTALERSRGKTGTPVDLNFPRQFRKAVDFRL